MHTVQRVWESTMRLFKHGQVEDTFKAELPKAQMRLALMVVLSSSILMAALAIFILLEQINLLDYAYDAAGGREIEVPQLVGEGQVHIFALFQLLFNVPFFVLFTFVYEGLAYGIFRASGGEGRFEGQLYLSSLVVLAMALTSGLGLLMPLPCIDILAFLALTVLTLYLTLFVQVKAYQVVHGISFLHGLTVVALLLVPRYLALFALTNAASALFGLPQPLDLGGV